MFVLHMTLPTLHPIKLPVDPHGLIMNVVEHSTSLDRSKPSYEIDPCESISVPNMIAFCWGENSAPPLISGSPLRISPWQSSILYPLPMLCPP